MLLGDLEALPVDDGGACLIVLLLADPHLLEGGQRGQDGAADPDGVFPLRGSDDLDRRKEQRYKLVREPGANILKHIEILGASCQFNQSVLLYKGSP